MTDLLRVTGINTRILLCRKSINQSINRQNRWSRTPPPPLLLWPLCSGYSSDHRLLSSWRQESPNLVNFGPVLHPSHPVFLTCNESNDIMQMIRADFIIRDSEKESSGTSLKKMHCKYCFTFYDDGNYWDYCQVRKTLE